MRSTCVTETIAAQPAAIASGVPSWAGCIEDGRGCDRLPTYGRTLKPFMYLLVYTVVLSNKINWLLHGQHTHFVRAWTAVHCMCVLHAVGTLVCHTRLLMFQGVICTYNGTIFGQARTFCPKLSDSAQEFLDNVATIHTKITRPEGAS